MSKEEFKRWLITQEKARKRLLDLGWTEKEIEAILRIAFFQRVMLLW